MVKRLLPLLLLASLFLAVGCTPAPAPQAPTPSPKPPTVTPIPEPSTTPTAISDPPTLPYDLSNVGVMTPTLPISEQLYLGLTYQKPNGNRLAVGMGRMASVQPIDILLEGVPAWVVGAPVDGGGTIWAVVLADGRVQGFMTLAGTITPIRIQPEQLPPGMPPVLVMYRGAPLLLTGPLDDASPLTHPVVLDGDPAYFAYVATDGDLVINNHGEINRLPVDALPDARILVDPRNRLLLVTGPTSRYAHGVLGDQLEGSSLTLIETDPAIRTHVISSGSQVIEGIIPIWADLNDDGDWEIVVTLSDDELGARIVIFNEAGDRLSEGPDTGRAFRWRHQLVAAPFEGGPNLIIADNLTPHIGGITEFYRWDPDLGLSVYSALEGYSTHMLGSRNLDRAVAGDLDGDGLIELLVPTESGDTLAAIRANGGFGALAWTVSLGSGLTTNIGTVTLLDDTLAVAVGLADGILRIWLP